MVHLRRTISGFPKTISAKTITWKKQFGLMVQRGCTISEIMQEVKDLLLLMVQNGCTISGKNGMIVAKKCYLQVLENKSAADERNLIAQEIIQGVDYR